MPYGWGLYQGENLVRGERREENIVDLQKRREEKKEDLQKRREEKKDDMQKSLPAGDEKAVRQSTVV